MDIVKCSVLANMLLALIWLVVLVAFYIRGKMRRRSDTAHRGCEGRQSSCTGGVMTPPYNGAAQDVSPCRGASGMPRATGANGIGGTCVGGQSRLPLRTRAEASVRDVEDAVPYSEVSKISEGRIESSAPTVGDWDAHGVAGIDLSGKRRETFALVLPSGETLRVYTPTKMVADLFADIGELLQRSAKGRATPEDSAELYRLAALVLGNNAERARVDAQALFAELTLDDVVELLTAYMQWLTDLIERKN